jgi:hypothetical protein
LLYVLILLYENITKFVMSQRQKKRDEREIRKELEGGKEIYS